MPYSKSLLYDDEHQTYKKAFPDQFRYDYAVSREQKNAAGQKMYIQTKWLRLFFIPHAPGSPRPMGRTIGPHRAYIYILTVIYIYIYVLSIHSLKET